jgi:hypothetical protein
VILINLVDGAVYTFGIGMTQRDGSSGYRMNALCAIPCAALKEKTTVQISAWDQGMMCLEGS